MPVPTLGVATTEGEGPEGRTGGTAGPYWMTTLSIPLITALPSEAQKPGRNEGAEVPFLEFNLGLPPELEPDVDCFCQELASSAREDSRSDSSQNPSGGIQKVGNLVGTGAWYAWLVALLVTFWWGATWSLGSDGALHLLPWWCCLEQCSPTGRIPEDQPETTISGNTLPASAKPSIEEAATEEAAPIGRPQEEPSTSQTPSEEPTRRVRSPIQFPGWREVLHPSRLVTAAGQTPPIPQESRLRPHSWGSGGRRAQHPRAEEHL